jgi:hypothetical protein
MRKERVYMILASRFHCSKAILYLLLLIIPAIVARAEVRDGKFEWANIELYGKKIDKAAILVPVEIKGSSLKFFAQLDTGSDGTIFYGKILEKFGLKFDSSGKDSIDFNWGLIDTANNPVWATIDLDWTRDDSVDILSERAIDRVIGSIGIDQINGKILILNLPSQEYSLLSDLSQLKTDWAGIIKLLDARQDRSGRLYVDVIIKNDTLKNVLFDTGSSSSTLTLPKELWQRATGLQGIEPSVQKDSITSWGVTLHQFRSPAKGDLEFGAITVKAPIIDFIEWQDPSLKDFKIMGLVPFCDKYIVVLDCKNSKFGLVESK